MSRRFLQVFLLFTSCCLLLSSAAAAVPDHSAFQQMLDSLVANSKTKTPGAVIAVLTPTAEFSVASGKAVLGATDLDPGTNMQPGDMLRIASMTKTFLATVVLKLAEENKLKLDDKISVYLPAAAGSSGNGETATVRNLLNMTSGIFEYYDNEAYLAAVADRKPRDAWSAEEIITKYVYGQPGPFEPGLSFKYTNSNSLLLEMIVRQVTNDTLAAQMRRIIFDPLKLANIFMEMAETRPGGFGGLLVRGYDTGQTPRKDITEQNDALGLGDGGLISDALGIARFLRVLFKDKTILNENSLGQMKTIGYSGKEYGLGLEVKTSRIYGTSWGHSGKSAGFQSEMRYYPDKDLALVILTNEENSDSDIIDTILAESLRRLLFCQGCLPSRGGWRAIMQ
jgi:D-alanyl-D-alanine carboxypeptidase